MTKNKAKAFDCIAYKRQVQAAIHEDTKDLSNSDLVEYFRRAVDESPFAEYFKAEAATSADCHYAKRGPV